MNIRRRARRRNTVIVGEGEGETEGETLSDTEGEIDELGLGDSDTEAEGLGESEIEALGLMEAEGLGEADGDTPSVSTSADLDTKAFWSIVAPTALSVVAVPGDEDTSERFCPDAPFRVSVPVTVCVPEAGSVTVRAVVHSRSRLAKVLLPVMVRAAVPVAVWRRVP